jgi:hypothetical protein
MKDKNQAFKSTPALDAAVTGVLGLGEKPKMGVF